MSVPSSSKTLRQKLNMEKYLGELTSLIGRPVHPDELGSLEQAATMREASQKFLAQAPQTCEILFSDRCSEQFHGFVQRLRETNACSVYIWTPRTIACGALLVPSLASVKFDFEFTINADGMLTFLTSDLEDSLLLDFSVAAAGNKIMRIETRGPNWGRVIY